MAKPPSSLQKSITLTTLKVLICLTLLRFCSSTTRNPFSNIDLSMQTLNPLTTGFQITGDVANDYFGFSVRTAGDINNDGYDDIIIGTPYKNNYHGIAYVIYGGQESSFLNIDLSTTTLNPLTTGFTIKGNAANNYLGYSVSSAGDIDNDGYDDIIIGADYKGAAYVIYGGPKSSMSNIDLSTTVLSPLSTGFTITGNALADYFGVSVSTVGDINGDGFDDIIVGAFYKDSQKGAAYVIYGGARSSMANINLDTQTLVPTINGFMINGNAANDHFGWSVSAAGDINKDGYSDIIVGAYTKSAAYVIYGGEISTRVNIDLGTQILDPHSTGFVITGDPGDNLGYSVRTAGDVDRDGYDDIIVGAHGTSSSRGAAYVIYGGKKSSMSNFVLSTTTLDPLSTGFMIKGNAVSNFLGFSVSGAGDINNDGYGDIIMGAHGKNSAYVLYGGAKSSMSNIDLSTQTLDPAVNGFTMTGDVGTDLFGWSVSTAGDINKDGYSDIIVGAAYKNNKQGAAYVFYASCPSNCNQCSSTSVCTECKNSYVMSQSQCLASCPTATFNSTGICKDCPSHCSNCISQGSCQVCADGYTLSNSLCILPPSSSQQTQEKASQTISSGVQGIGSVVSVGSAVFPQTALVSKIVQNTRYMNISVTSDLAEIYKTWGTDMISWNVPNILSSEDHFKTAPYLFSRYEIDSPFLVNFWPTLLNIGIGLSAFVTCIALQKLLERGKYGGWVFLLVRKLVAGSFNFTLIQAYACLDDILFYLVIDIKTNPFNSFFSWASLISAFLFLALGCLLVFFNFWTVKKYQNIKGNQGDLEAFNERNKYWELFYSDFNDDDLWSQSFFAFLIIRSSLSSFIITVLYDYPLMQTPYLIILDGAILLFLYFKNPFNTLRGKLAQYFYEAITLLVHLCTFILSLQDSFVNPSDTTKLILSTGIIYLNTALVMGSIGFMFIEIYKTISQKTRAGRRYESIAIQTGTEDVLTQRRRESYADSLQAPSPSENSQLLPGAKNDGNLMESSQTLESSSNFNNQDNSVLSDVNSGDGGGQRKDQSTKPILVRRKLRIVQPSLQENKSVVSECEKIEKIIELS